MADNRLLCPGCSRVEINASESCCGVCAERFPGLLKRMRLVGVRSATHDLDNQIGLAVAIATPTGDVRLGCVVPLDAAEALGSDILRNVAAVRSARMRVWQDREHSTPHPED